ncbi:MAG: UDP-N-acetylglucosamine 2-epimerase (non-hydrolyzing) [Alphaproteobacteria bacterium]|nr:UDP-N-acetylglucosamine 2-epimerase (non-hydrolyzing) [Alphaproteobacteria bacterium]
MGQKTLVTVVGTRPQFVKAFPLSRALQAAPDFREAMIHTGQHFDDNMSAVFFSELGIRPPDHHFSVAGTTHGAMTGDMLARIEQVLLSARPDAVLVYGDTNSTLAGALAAAKLGIPLVHVEAGLRSFNRAMPEEINRIVADHLAQVLICPTRAAIGNLKDEGIVTGVHLAGDLMYDAMRLATPIAERASKVLERLGMSPKSYGVATVHRAANTDEPDALAPVLDYIANEARRQPIVFPIHPRTVAAMKRAGLDPSRPGIVVTEPVGYLDMCRLLHHATVVLTDSGGVQKEAYFHRVPCVTLRDETEWTETVDCGWNRLWRGPDYAPRRDIADYGDGDAAAEIVALMRDSL